MYTKIKRNMAIIAVIITFSIILFGMARSSFNVMAKDMDSDQKRYYQEYYVKPGDTLWSISEEFRSSVYRDNNEYIKDLEEVNHINRDHILTEGRLLILPVYKD